jgi:RNA polymerase sigma factor (sigma-70 family)
VADQTAQIPPDVAQQFMDDYTNLLHSTAAYWGRQYKHVVDVNDVASELWLYLFRRWEWVLELIEERGAKRAAGKLKMRLTDVARGFCVDEHNKRYGIARDDLAWYTTGQVADLLNAALDLDQWVKGSPEKRGAERSAPSRPSEHGTRMAMLADVAHAYSKLSDDDQEILHLRYVDGLDNPSSGRALDISTEAAEKRTERALRRLVDKLGGNPPIWPAGRHSVSNAAAQARVRKAYDS